MLYKFQILIKVTVYLQGWLQFNGCSASRLHHRYPKPCIKLKLIELGIQIFHCLFKKQIPKFSAQSKLEGPDRRSRVPTQYDFYILEVCFFLEVRTPKAEKECRGFLQFDCVQKLQNIFTTARKTCGVNAWKWPSRKEFLELSYSPKRFC